MKLKYAINITVLTCALVGCNTTGIDAQNPAAMPASGAYQEITVYSSHSDIPYKYKVIGKVTAQNTYPNDVKASPEAIIVELKRQASLLGASGIMHITPGLKQTTADALRVK